MKMEKWGKKKVSIIATCCILVMLLLFCSGLHLTFAWLQNQIKKDSTGTTGLAGIDDTVNSTSGTYEVTMGNAGVNTSLSNYSLITNTGTTEALVRVFYSIYINEDNKEIATTGSISEVKINSGFIASDENIENVHSGYYYYNSTLAPGTQISFLNSAKATSLTAGKNIKINMIVELVNWQGGAYQLGQDIPWKNTPASWNFNNTTITKTNGEIVSPKLEIKFSEISKIEMTAKTTTNSQNILFCRTGNAYVGMNGSTWTFNQLTGGVASLTPAQFTNGNFNTITFTWTGCTSTTDDYITLVWDSVWSKEISYKQIKIWNTDGDLVYDLIPNVTKNGSSIVSADGTFINKVNNIVMPMYSLSGHTLTSTTNKYSGFSEVVYSFDFENGVNFGNSNGAFCEITETEVHYGSKAQKVTNTLNVEDIAAVSTAKMGWRAFQGKTGYKYTFSLWVKSTAPAGALSYIMYKEQLYGSLPTLCMTGSAIGTCAVQYTGVNDWTLLSVSTGVLESDCEISFCLEIPTGTEYVTYVDDVIIKAYK